MRGGARADVSASCAAAAQEARSLLKARKLGVATPVLYHVDTRASCLYMEFVPGRVVKEQLYAGLDSAGACAAGCRLHPHVQP